MALSSEAVRDAMLSWACARVQFVIGRSHVIPWDSRGSGEMVIKRQGVLIERPWRVCVDDVKLLNLRGWRYAWLRDWIDVSVVMQGAWEVMGILGFAEY